MIVIIIGYSKESTMHQPINPHNLNHKPPKENECQRFLDPNAIVELKVKFIQLFFLYTEMKVRQAFQTIDTIFTDVSLLLMLWDWMSDNLLVIGSVEMKWVSRSNRVERFENRNYHGPRA